MKEMKREKKGEGEGEEVLQGESLIPPHWGSQMKRREMRG
jgi:hypothetical protein